MRRAFVLGLLAAVVATSRAAEPSPGPEPDELRAVIVEEEGDTIEVWIDLSPSVDPGSVEVQLAGRVIAVRARGDSGRALHSAPLHAREPVVEEGAEARVEGSWLVVELRKDT